VIRLVARHTLEMPPGVYWKRCFLDAAYERELFLAELRYARFDSDNRTQPGTLGPHGTVELTSRRVVAEPGAHDVPFAHVIGRALAYVEQGTLDQRKGVYMFGVRNLVLPDALTLRGAILVEATSYTRSVFVAEVDAEVSLLGIGDAIEKRLEHELRRSFRLAVELANVWVAADGGAGLATFRAGRKLR